MKMAIHQIDDANKTALVPTKTMRDSDTVYRFTAAQLAELHDMGVADPVLNYMQQTYIDAERRQQSLEDWDRDGIWGPYDW